MKLRTTITRSAVAAAVTAAALVIPTTPASASDTGDGSISIVDANGTRYGYTSWSLVTCGWPGFDHVVRVEYQLSDGTTDGRIVPTPASCTYYDPGGKRIVRFRGWVDGFANPWIGTSP